MLTQLAIFYCMLPQKIYNDSIKNNPEIRSEKKWAIRCLYILWCIKSMM